MLDEFDLDIRLEPVPLPPLEDGHKDGPKNTQPGSTCQFSCQLTCGGTCECPTNPEHCVEPEVITHNCSPTSVC
ncbi:hypothetical protein KCMC57_up61620 [Kitasatospora sp. CMC57]|uniref:Uncharacterized protein n=1 Tax=Kitasatospora sp. CMC57 TaxID=3231513 RepID=A0AB33K8G0_9ACTN